MQLWTVFHGNRLDTVRMEGDRHAASRAVLVDLLDDQLYDPRLLTDCERFPDRYEIGERFHNIVSCQRLGLQRLHFCCDDCVSMFCPMKAFVPISQLLERL